MDRGTIQSIKREMKAYIADYGDHCDEEVINIMFQIHELTNTQSNKLSILKSVNNTICRDPDHAFSDGIGRLQGNDKKKKSQKGVFRIWYVMKLNLGTNAFLNDYKKVLERQLIEDYEISFVDRLNQHKDYIKKEGSWGTNFDLALLGNKCKIRFGIFSPLPLDITNYQFSINLPFHAAHCQTWSLVLLHNANLNHYDLIKTLANNDQFNREVLESMDHDSALDDSQDDQELMEVDSESNVTIMEKKLFHYQSCVLFDDGVTKIIEINKIELEKDKDVGEQSNTPRNCEDFNSFFLAQETAWVDE
uniref:OTU domain-containing protein n=1 Tax=Rhabditophanes sp. KR3021 TaxID=114890 RepID=A0AC35TWM2_9BILA